MWKWGTCQLAHLVAPRGGGTRPGSRGNVHLRARRTEFEVVCEQASKCALAWPSESFLLFLISIFFFFPPCLFLFLFSFPLRVFCLHLLSSKPRSNLRGPTTVYPASSLPIRHVQLKSPRAIVQPNFQLTIPNCPDWIGNETDRDSQVTPRRNSSNQ